MADICGAKTKRGKGPPCRQKPMANGRCRLHGGATPKGVESPNFKTGRYSRYMPDGLAAFVDDNDLAQDLFDMRDEIRIIDARVRQLLQDVEYGGAPATWRQLRKLRLEALRAEASRDKEALNASVNEILRLIDRGASETRSWEEILRRFLERDKLVNSQHKRQVDAAEMISRDRLLVLISRLIESARNRFSNTEEVVGFIGDVRTILSTRTRGQA